MPHTDAVIRVYDETGNVIETHKHKGEFKEPSVVNVRAELRQWLEYATIIRTVQEQLLGTRRTRRLDNHYGDDR